MTDEETPLLRDSPDHDERPDYTNGDAEDRAGNGSQVAGGSDEVLKPQIAIKSVILPLVLGIFLVAMDQTIVASTYASIGTQFDALETTSWIATGYMLTLSSCQPLYGKLSDIFGRKICLIFAYTVFAIGCLLCGLATNMPQLIGARAFAGIGGGGMSTVGSIILSDVVPLRQRGTWQGVVNIVFAAGAATGAPLGGFLADTIGWRWAFLAQAPLMMFAILSVVLGLELPARDTSHFREKIRRIDFPGAFTLVVAIFSLLLALDRGGNTSWFSRVTLSAFGVFGLSFVAFLLVELRWAAEPFAPRHIIANRALLFSYLCNFLLNGAFMNIIFYVPLFLQAVKQMSASQVGWVLVPCIVGGVFASLGSGLIMQATGRYYWLAFGGFVTMLASTICVALVTGPLRFSVVWLCIGLFGTNFGGGAGITTTLIALIANAGPENQAMATAVSYLFRSLGSVVGLSIGTTLAQDTLRLKLHERLQGADVDEIILRVRESLSYIETLPAEVRAAVVRSYQDSVQVALWFAVGLTVLTLGCSVFIKEKHLAK